MCLSLGTQILTGAFGPAVWEMNPMRYLSIAARNDVVHKCSQSLLLLSIISDGHCFAKGCHGSIVHVVMIACEISTTISSETYAAAERTQVMVPSWPVSAESTCAECFGMQSLGLSFRTSAGFITRLDSAGFITKMYTLKTTESWCFQSPC